MAPIVAMLPSIISSVAGAAGGIAGIIKSNQASQQAREEQRKRDAFNKSMFNRQYYQDALSRSDTQNMLRNYRETMREAIKNQQNTAVVTGETPRPLPPPSATTQKPMPTPSQVSPPRTPPVKMLHLQTTKKWAINPMPIGSNFTKAMHKIGQISLRKHSRWEVNN